MFGSKLKIRKFEKEIEQYEAVPVVTDKILFYGHSLFTRCSFITSCKENPLLEEEVRMKDGSQAIVNHGFGSSSADDLLYYYHRMVLPYKPRALVLATSSNDIAYGYDVKDIMEIVARLVQWAQADFPGIRVYCIGRGPSLKNKGQKNIGTRARKEYNEYLELFCNRTENCFYVPLHMQPFYYENEADIGDCDKIREDIFHADRTHLNPQGYAMFMDFIRELLDDLL